MDSESKHASRLLTAVAVSCERIIDLAINLRLRPEIIEVLQCTDLRNLESGPTVDTYADAQLVCGKGITWWLEIDWDENQWTIESRVTIADLTLDEGSKDIFSFPDRVARTIPEFIARLEEATSELINSAEFIDLTTCQPISGSEKR